MDQRGRPTSAAGFLAVDGGNLYFEVAGEGEALVFIHGWLGSLRMWDYQAQAFAGSYRVVRCDMRGFGRSTTEHVEFAYWADVAALLDHLGVDRVHVVGQSFGGSIALDLALARPACVATLTSVAGGVSGYHPDLKEDNVPRGDLDRLWDEKRWVELAELETQIWVDGWGQPTTRVGRTLRDSIKGDVLSTYQAENEEGLPQALEPRAADRLGELTVPVLVMIGTLDEARSRATAAHLVASVSDSRSVEVAGVAHMIQLEAPERVSEVLRGFFQDHPL
ncbi:MAG: alpha/beta hydrolase [Pseudomonadales bacterium]|nr:alpha/beta hydrolase [Pseudomonadales bacterium]